MSTHFKWYPASEEVIVPFNARYSFPSQVTLTFMLGQQGCQNDTTYSTKERFHFSTRSSDASRIPSSRYQ